MGKYAYILLVTAVLLLGNSSLFAQISDEEEANIEVALLLWKDLNNTIPNYDINNSPIAFYLLKDKGSNVGFMVTGHAEMSVCKMASLELMTFLDKHSKHKNSYFSFGIAFDMRPLNTNLWTKEYSDDLQELYNKFEALQRSVNMPEYKSVVADTINYDEYIASKTALNELSEAEKSMYDKGYVTVVEHDLPQIPYIIGFQNAKGEPISFELSKKALKSLEPEYLYSSYLAIVKDYEDDLKDMAKKNRESLYALKYKDTSDQYLTMLSVSKELELVFNEYYLPAYPRHTSLWTITDSVTGEVTHTFNYVEVLKYAEEVKEFNNQQEFEKGIKDYEEWFERSMDQYDSLYNAYRKEMPKAYALHQKNFSYWTNEIKGYRQQIYQIDGTEIMVDAFLRGWPVTTSDPDLDDKLDAIYVAERQQIWIELMQQHPNANIEGDMAGVFQSENVFFQVSQAGSKYVMVPFQVLGGPISRITHPSRDLVRYFSPYLLRRN